jgi:ParB family chromosome partitioning protein
MSTTITNTPTIAIDKIVVPDGFNARQSLDLNDGFIGSIRKEGVRQPIIVTNGRDAGNVTLVAGHRRLAAAKQTGLTEIPYTLGEEEKATADAALENLARRNLNPVEEARAFRAMLDDGYTKDGIAKTTGYSNSRTATAVSELSVNRPSTPSR